MITRKTFFAAVISISYDYSSAKWYAKSAKSGKTEWSAPYYDIDGAGLFMITCSIPVLVLFQERAINCATTNGTGAHFSSREKLSVFISQFYALSVCKI
jgi:hypothetical protein